MPRFHLNVDDADGLWRRDGPVAVRGHAFRDGDLLRPDALLALVEATPVEAITGLLAELDGFFSVARVTDETASLAVDHVQSYPLFYAVADGTAYLSNDAHWIVERLPDPRVDPLCELEFVLSGTVTGRDTLYPDVTQLAAGDLVVLDASGGDVAVRTTRHARFRARPQRAAAEADLLDDLDAVLAGAFDRLLAVADGRQLAISLSGGPDSRLIASMLRRLDYDDVVAFTFGFDGNWDSTVAVEVADALSIPIEVVPYDHAMWFEWFGSEEREAYYRYAFDFDALPAFGAVPAMGQLHREGRLDNDAIVLCGNLVPVRPDVPREFSGLERATQDALVDAIFDRYYGKWALEDDAAEAALRSRIRSQVDDVEGADRVTLLAAWKDWRVRNRQAKLMVTPEEYAFYGYDAWTPLWDAACVRFWETVPIAFRADKRLHVTYTDALYRELTGRPAPAPKPTVGPLRRFERAIARSPLERFVRPVYERVEARYARYTRSSEYHTHPLATPGIVSEAQFEALADGPDRGVHGFAALEAVGCVAFDPPRNLAGPVDGVVSLDRLRTADHAAYRDSLPWFPAPSDRPGVRPLDPTE